MASNKRFDVEKNVIRFDVIQGRCGHCSGPLYFTQTIDWEGNRVNALHCWNGHYEKIEIEHPEINMQEDLTQEQVEAIMPFIGFVEIPEGTKDEE